MEFIESDKEQEIHQRMVDKLRKNFFTVIVLYCIAVTFVLGQNKEGIMAFTISMENPNTHYYHVVFHCEGIRGETLDFKMPVWTPGYYWILNLAKNIANFEARDVHGNQLDWHKINKNTWRVNSDNASDIRISYDVFAFRQSVAEPFLDDGRAFISPTGIFLHIDGLLQHPVSVTVKPYHEWSQVNTGLDIVEGIPHTFYASNFDVLYDCPILVGNQEVLSFEVGNIVHTVAMENPVNIDHMAYLEDLKKIVIHGSAIIGEIPYKHYTYLFMGRGGGGLEHSNSMAVFSNLSYDLTQSARYKRWLAFLAHEYFHLYNVKAIRPIALGPFDYDRENYTNMLWVSEGLTVYYEYIILNRAGILSRQETLDILTRTITKFENIPGHQFQSATESSFNTWLNFFNRNNHTANTTISYYDIGCTLGLLLDLKIRHETKNEKSLDDVMKTLYYTFYKEKKRGFTDQEFRDVCEQTAGCSLEEIFNYASNAQPFDYKKYLAYAGIHIELEQKVQPGAYWGAAFQKRGEKIVVSYVEWDSPAWKAGLSVQDQILRINDKQATSETLALIAKEGIPGERTTLLVNRRTGEKKIELILDQKIERSFQMKPLANPNPLQLNILNVWLKDF